MTTPDTMSEQSDAEIERILAMSDEEVMASATAEEVGWAKGFGEGLRLLRRVRDLGRQEGLRRAAEMLAPFANVAREIPADFSDDLVVVLALQGGRWTFHIAADHFRNAATLEAELTKEPTR